MADKGQKPIHLGNIDEQPQNRDWLRTLAKQDEAKRQAESTRLANESNDPDKQS